MYNYNSGYTNRPTGGVVQNAWMHLIITRLQATGFMTTYYNGVSVASGLDNSNYTANTCFIGHRSDFNEPLFADIGLFRVYKGTAFTSSMVTQNFNAHRGRFGV